MANKPTLNEEQKEAFEAIRKFLKHPAADTFVLKGYAGTGKTFLMQHLATWLGKEEEQFCMLASTGRAASVLRGKTGFESKTVHGELYQFAKVNGDSEDIANDASIEKFGQMTLQFDLRQPDQAAKLYIVDEASMLASEASDNSSFASFGSGSLLQDLFIASGNSKIIFVGDPCQLPPIGQTFSPALDMDWLSSQGRTAVSITLKRIERTTGDNDILKLAHYVRDLSLRESWEKYIKLPAKGLNSVHLTSDPNTLFKDHVSRYRKEGSGYTIAIARSNKIVQQINKAMRQNLYQTSDVRLRIGDILLVTQNNYAVPLTNGDFVTVLAIEETYTQAGLNFQRIKVKAALSENEYEILLSLDILYSNSSNFTQEQLKMLMVDFSRRMRNKNIKPNSEKYRTAMMADDYVNCLRATYGYAVTCHKAQGGEWPEVSLFLDKGMYAMPSEELCRWWYTAITRTKQSLHLSEDWWIV